MIQWIKNKWEAIKGWFHYSETIFIARAEALGSLLVGAIAGFNWEALLAMDWSKGFNKEILIGAGIWFIKALVQEWARKRNATDL